MLSVEIKWRVSRHVPVEDSVHHGDILGIFWAEPASTVASSEKVVQQRWLTCTSRPFFPAAASPCLIAEQSPAALQQSDHFHHPSLRKLASCRKAATSFHIHQFPSQTDNTQSIMNTVSSMRTSHPIVSTNSRTGQISIVRHTSRRHPQVHPPHTCRTPTPSHQKLQ